MESCIEFYACLDEGKHSGQIISYILTDTPLNENVAYSDEQLLICKLTTYRIILFIQIHAVMNHPEIAAMMEKMAYDHMGGPTH